jgi:hypothetical protein
MVVKPALVKPGDTLGERSRGAVPGPVRELDKWARRRPAPMARGARAGPRWPLAWSAWRRLRVIHRRRPRQRPCCLTSA